MHVRSSIERVAFVPIETFEQFGWNRTIGAKPADRDFVNSACLSRPLNV
ncbi:hypothetical protein [Burkholderia cepacia]|nr:hypothetical protein [Burkholderia cepacia]